MSFTYRPNQILPRIQARVSITLEITKHGGARMLHNDALDLSEFGQVEVTRASHVEFSNESGAWFVASAKTLKVLAHPFATRAAALEWEKNYYSPGAAGWKEITS